MSLGSKTNGAISALGAFLTVASGAYLLAKDQLNPNKPIHLAAEAILTTNSGQQIICQNLSTWNEPAHDAQILAAASAAKGLYQCADRIEANESRDLLAVRFKYWVVTNGSANKDRIPSGAQPYFKTEGGEDVKAVYELGNKSHAKAAADKLREVAIALDKAEERLQLPEPKEPKAHGSISTTAMILGAAAHVPR